MIYSIRRFLLLNLLIGITIATTLTILGNYLLDQKDIENHLDALLSQSALAFQALISDDIKSRNLIKVQNRLDAVPQLTEKYYKKSRAFLDANQNKFEFQLIDLKTKKLLLHSANAPLESLSNNSGGFSITHVNSNSWRVFTAIDKNDGLMINIAERYDIREQLLQHIALDDIYIMLVVYPLLGVLIWIIISKGLYPLTKITTELSERAPDHLSPVDLANIPVEITPVVDALNKLFLRLQRALDREKRFSADAAHELRTPLAGLKTQTQLALKIHNQQERSEALNKLLQSVDRCTHIVEQLLTLSRLVPEEPHMLEGMTPISLYHIAVDIIGMLVPKALDKNIELELICENENIMVNGNNTALGILLRNLVDNAIRYSPSGSHVKVIIEETDDNVILSVIDNGPGIPPKLRMRVFERFFRILGHQASGSGLGLAIVQQIASLHQAKVKLMDTPSGVGLRVNVYFSKLIDGYDT
jgi:two-component system, OmpR family, sensor histidine kinase QseC